MRQITIGTTQVTYPEYIVWKNDSNVVELESASNVGAEITIEEPAGKYYTLEYYSDQSRLLFYLDDAIKALYNDNIGTWRCRIAVYDGGLPTGNYTFTFKVLNGKSFITRSHGVASTIYVYNPDELVKLQVFSTNQCLAFIGQYSFSCYEGLNQFNLSSAIRDYGEFSLCLNDSNSVPPLVNVLSDTPIAPTSTTINLEIIETPSANTVIGGDVFEQNKTIFPICHKIIYEKHCDDYSFGEITYTDLDGMRRYLGGKILTDTDDVKTESYITSSIDIYKTTPNRYIIDRTKTIKLGLFDIEKAAYPYDLINSDSILYRTWDGEWKPCTLKTQTLTRKDDLYYDFELEIIVSQ